MCVSFQKKEQEKKNIEKKNLMAHIIIHRMVSDNIRK